MDFRPRRIVAPDKLPVSVDEMKAHLRVDHGDDDAYIAGVLQSAVDHLDGYDGILGRCLITQTWQQEYAGWGVLKLPFPDVDSVSVSYTDKDNIEQTVAGSQYDLTRQSHGAFLRFRSTFGSPQTADIPAPIRVSLVAGFGGSNVTPWALKSAIMLHAATLYEYRETTSKDWKPTQAYERLVVPYRWAAF